MNFNEFSIRNATKAQVKLAQEIALAERISNSDTVEIEEYFGRDLRGKVGLSNFFFGLGGSRQKVTKRIIRFKGKK